MSGFVFVQEGLFSRLISFRNDNAGSSGDLRTIFGFNAKKEGGSEKFRSLGFFTLNTDNRAETPDGETGIAPFSLHPRAPAVRLMNLISCLPPPACFPSPLLAFTLLAIAPAALNASPYLDAVRADGPLLHYRFEETGGTTATDSSENHHDGNLINPGGLGFQQESAHSGLGSCFEFSGGFLELPNLGTHSQSTIEAWVRPDSIPGGGIAGLLTANGWAPGRVHLNLNGSTFEYAVNGGTPTATVSALETIIPGNWYHLVVTNDTLAGETKIYLNGTESPDTGDQIGQAVVFGVTGLQIGAWDGGRLFDGRIDEVAVYDRVLSPERVAAHFQAASEPLTPRINSFTISDGRFDSSVGLALPLNGGEVHLRWEVERADTIEINQGILESSEESSGSVATTVGTDTTYTLTATNQEGSVTATVRALLAPSILDPLLTEFMAENDGSLLDGHGKSPDWIEIHNPNPFPMDLAGHRLRDGSNSWTFPPDSHIPALGYRVVFASGDPTPDPEGWLHVGFSLNNSGEPLAWQRPDGGVINEFSPVFPRQYADISFGTSPVHSPGAYFLEPTPGAANGPGYESLLDKEGEITFTHGHGFYLTDFAETISGTIPGASLIYTTDGSTPTPGNGTRVDPPDSLTPPNATVPVTIDGSTNAGVTTLRAILVKEGSAPSRVATQTYLFSAAVVSQSTASTIASGWPASPVNGQVFDYGMTRHRIGPDWTSLTQAKIARSLESLPTLSLVTDLDHLVDPLTGIYVNARNWGKAWERPVSVELILPEGSAEPDGHPGGFQIDAGLRMRGGASRGPQFFKHAFRLFFRQEYGEDKLRHPLFGKEGVDEFDKIDLRSSSNFDWAREGNLSDGSQFTFAREVFSRDTQGAMGQPHTKSRYYHLYLNGTYWGIYQTQERAEAAFGASYFGGNRDDFDTVKSSNHVGGFTTEATDGNLDAFRDLWERCREIGLRDASNENYYALQGLGPDGVRDPDLPVLLDVDNLIDYMITIFWTGDGDAVLSNFLANNRANNWFGIRNRKGDEGFRFFAHDAEHTLGTSTSREDRTGPFTGSNQDNFLYANPQWMHQDLMANPEYRLRFADRAQRHFFRNGALTTEAAIERFTKRTSQVAPALPAYGARWADARYLPSYHFGFWENETSEIVTSWIPGRTAIVLDQLRADGLYPDLDPPLFIDAQGTPVPDGSVPSGFALHLDLPDDEGILFYTLDGSDPRLPAANPVEPSIVLVDFDDPRAYHVPTSASDGFQANPVLSVAPLAHYPFDTDARDQATANGAQDGTLYNGAFVTPEGRIGPGALSLDGLNDHVSLGNPPVLQITGQITMAAWVKARSAPAQTFGNILAKGYWLNPNSEIFLRYAGQIDSWRVASWDGTVHGTEVPGASGDLGQWVHLVGTYDGSRWNLYRNGILAASTPAATGAIDVPSNWAIGARGTGTERFFDGLIDEVYLFDSALGLDDIQKLYSGSGPEWPNPAYPGATSWQTGIGGLGYDETGSLDPLIDTDLGPLLKDSSTSLYIRSDFEVPEGSLSGADSLKLDLYHDAGFVAYLNGVEVHRVHAPGALDGASRATASHATPPSPVTVDLSAHLPLLQEGRNILAIHSLNESTENPDHLIRYRLGLGRTPAATTASAMEYTGPITINGPTRVNARLFRGGKWSALTSAFLHHGTTRPTPENLVVSQIHYHPVALPGDSFEPKDYEFIELMNIGPDTLDLQALELDGDVGFAFPPDTYLAPGERAQVVSNQTAFEQRYGSGTGRILGQYLGHLDNGGGRILLTEETTGIVRDFSYDDQLPWPTIADGSGHGLVLIHPADNPDHSDPVNWRASASRHGTPGEGDEVRFTGDPEADQDEDGLTALMEHALGSSDGAFSDQPWSLLVAGGNPPFAEASVTRRSNADDVLWIPEYSTDLENWIPLTNARTVPADQAGLVIESYSLSGQPATTRIFLRVRVVKR